MCFAPYHRGKLHNQKQLEEGRIDFCLQFMKGGRAGQKSGCRNWSRGHGQTLLTGLMFVACQGGTIHGEMGLLTCHQSIKEMTHKLAYRRIRWGRVLFVCFVLLVFFQLSFFSDDFSLCQVVTQIGTSGYYNIPSPKETTAKKCIERTEEMLGG